MCASVCPSGALFFGTREEVERLRPRSAPTNRFQFGEQSITTKVHFLAPRNGHVPLVEVTSGMHEAAEDKVLSLDLMDANLFVSDGEA